AERWLLLTLAAATVLAGSLVALVPRAIEAASVDDLNQALEQAAPVQRNLVFEQETRLGAGPEGNRFELVERRLDILIEERVPGDVAELIEQPTFVYESPRLTVSYLPELEAGPFPTTFNFRSYQGIADHTTLVRGREPAAAEPLPLAFGDCPANIDLTLPPDELPDGCAIASVPVFEVLLSEQTATDMRVEVDSDLLLLPDVIGDRAWRTAERGIGDVRLVARVVGIVALSDQQEPFWFGDSSLHRPRITENADYRLVYGAGLFSDDQYLPLLRAFSGVDADYEFRYLLDRDRVASSNPADLIASIERIDRVDLTLVTDLPAILATHLEQRNLALRLVSLVLVGVACSAIAAAAMLARVSARRRRSALLLIERRGASRTQLMVPAAGSALVASLPAAGAALAASKVLVPDASWAVSVRLTALLVLGTVVAVAAIGSRPPRSARSAASDMRRVTAEITVLVLAAASLALVRRRATTTAAEAGIDWLLAAVPVLVLVAATLVARHVITPVASVLAAVGTRATGLTWPVGLQRLHRNLGRSASVFAACVLSIGIASMALVEMAGLDDRAQAAAWSTVGGDFRIESLHPDIGLPSELGPLLDGAPLVALGRTLPTVRFSGAGATAVAQLVAVDTADYSALLSTSGGFGGATAALNRVATADAQAQPSGPIPAIAVGFGSQRLLTGDVVNVSGVGTGVEFEVVGSIASMPGVTARSGALVVDLGHFASVANDRFAEPTWAVLSGNRAAEAAAVELVADLDGVAMTSRYAVLDQLVADPLTSWTRRGLLAAGAISLSFAIVAVAASVVVAQAASRHDYAMLAILGT
ncbi:MAG: hypothetical protein KDB16_20585, partial [Acidimicrobiales bacterium]|nr:hypothetical protein [Acidimicrobiales bacterium]